MKHIYALTWRSLAQDSEELITLARKHLRHDSPAYQRIERHHNQLMNLLHENRPHNDGSDPGVIVPTVDDPLYTYYDGKPWCSLLATEYAATAVVRLNLRTARHPDNQLMTGLDDAPAPQEV